MTDIIVGIDLGTTNSEIAVYREGRIEVLADEAGRRILPSVVGLAEDGSLLVGEEARNQYLLSPERTVRSIKRKMGSDHIVTLAGQTYTPQEISALILRRLKETAERRLGQAVTRAVITVPAYFSDAQRQATREAGQIAGLVVERIINEPTAAALAYEAGRQDGKRILVYDLGGGTFDVSVVRIESGVVEVLSSHGNNHLGGDDFDAKIVTWLTDHLKLKHGVDVSDQPRALARIHRAAEDAKKLLSDAPYARIEEEYLTEAKGLPVHLSVELSRDDYERMITPYIEETLEAVHIALAGASLNAGDMAEILLVGGATRTPLVHRRLREVFGQEPHGEVDPDLCVAMGAALQGAAIAGADISAVLVDVTPYTFGTSALAELDGELYPFRFFPVIAKNTPIPVRRSEVFYTASDNQDAVQVRIFQGENPDALQNIQIGEFLVDGLSPVPSGNPIVFEMELDRDGILKVTAREKNTGLEGRITIDRATSRYETADLDTARQRIGALFGDESGESGEIIDATADGDGMETLLGKATAKLQSLGESEDREELIDLLELIHDARAADEKAALAEHLEQLRDLLFYLES